LGILLTPATEYLRQRRARLVKRHGIDVAKVETLLVERTQSRIDKNFTRADEIRAALTAMSVEIFDGSAGSDWRVRDDAREEAAAV
jgi:cysteinyl-tRNA synthetase